jgi:hypothetical protein
MTALRAALLVTLFVPGQGDYKGVRAFAQQVQRVASSNYCFFSEILNEKSTVNADAPLTSKADLMKLLRDSFAYGVDAVAGHAWAWRIRPTNRGIGSGMIGAPGSRSGPTIVPAAMVG